MKGSAAFVLFLTAAALTGQPCAPAATRLCLSGGRFSTEVSWKDFQGRTGVGQAVALTRTPATSGSSRPRTSS